MRFLLLLLFICGCAGSPAPARRTGLPGRAPLMDAPDRPDAFMVLVYESDVRAQAERVTREVHLFHDAPVRLIYDEPYWRVVMGDFTRKLRAEEVANEVHELGYPDTRIIPLFRKDRNGNP